MIPNSYRLGRTDLVSMITSETVRVQVVPKVTSRILLEEHVFSVVRVGKVCCA
jgi:hypothetical protein